MVLVLHYQVQYDIGKEWVLKVLKSKYKHGIGTKILSPNIGKVCTLPKVRVLPTFKLITSTISLDPKLIHVIMPTCIFIIITNVVCTYPCIQPMLLPKREHLITAKFSYSS